MIFRMLLIVLVMFLSADGSAGKRSTKNRKPYISQACDACRDKKKKCTAKCDCDSFPECNHKCAYCALTSRNCTRHTPQKKRGPKPKNSGHLYGRKSSLEKVGKKRKRKRSTRACDYCTTKKIKCESNPGFPCNTCKKLRKSCTIDIKKGKRGPKPKSGRAPETAAKNDSKPDVLELGNCKNNDFNNGYQNPFQYEILNSCNYRCCNYYSNNVSHSTHCYSDEDESYYDTQQASEPFGIPRNCEDVLLIPMDEIPDGNEYYLDLGFGID